MHKSRITTHLANQRHKSVLNQHTETEENYSQTNLFWRIRQNELRLATWTIKWKVIWASTNEKKDAAAKISRCSDHTLAVCKVNFLDLTLIQKKKQWRKILLQLRDVPLIHQIGGVDCSVDVSSASSPLALFSFVSKITATLSKFTSYTTPRWPLDKGLIHAQTKLSQATR